jgi:3D (Asp-Asp-Asp) domain-containing protein
VAVNPSVIPYGTRLYIPGYGYCTAQDTGAFRHEEGGAKNQIDVFLNTEKECIRWGRKYNVTVYILK